MSIYCEKCNGYISEHKHHKFSNTKKNREMYGKLLDLPFNIQFLCSTCHLNKSLDKFTEKQFREELKKRGHELPAGTKSFQLQEKRSSNDTLY